MTHLLFIRIFPFLLHDEFSSLILHWRMSWNCPFLYGQNSTLQALLAYHKSLHLYRYKIELLFFFFHGKTLIPSFARIIRNIRNYIRKQEYSQPYCPTPDLSKEWTSPLFVISDIILLMYCKEAGNWKQGIDDGPPAPHYSEPIVK